jgi:hypothetical protein
MLLKKHLQRRVKTGAANINFTLKTQCTLSGTVVDIYGSVIPGAQVQARSDTTGQIVSALTDQEEIRHFGPVTCK